MRIYFVGSHATGKTTMTRFVSRRFGLPMITEVARAVLAELETNLDNLRTDMDLVADYQKRVFERQIQVEKLQQSGFVSDRAFDNLAYAAEHTMVVGDMLQEDTFKNYMQWVSHGSIVFFVRPHKDLLKEDGVRAGVTWESVLRIDGMIKFMLEQYRVPYMPLESVSMQERARVIDFVLSRAGLSALKPEESSPPKIVSLFAQNGNGAMMHAPDTNAAPARIIAPTNGSAESATRQKAATKPARA